eukprot:85433-Amphidinium_carterae.1
MDLTPTQVDLTATAEASRPPNPRNPTGPGLSSKTVERATKLERSGNKRGIGKWKMKRGNSLKEHCAHSNHRFGNI